LSEPDPNDPRLLTNLGADPVDLAKGKIPMSRMGIHTPFSAEYWAYARVRTAMGSLFWKLEYMEGQDQDVGVGGRARIQVIHGESVRHGAQADLKSEFEKPGIVDRLREVVQPGRYEEKRRKELGLDE